jgi:hypothetical protein
MQNRETLESLLMADAGIQLIKRKNRGSVFQTSIDSRNFDDSSDVWSIFRYKHNELYGFCSEAVTSRFISKFDFHRMVDVYATFRDGLSGSLEERYESLYLARHFLPSSELIKDAEKSIVHFCKDNFRVMSLERVESVAADTGIQELYAFVKHEKRYGLVPENNTSQALGKALSLVNWSTQNAIEKLINLGDEASTRQALQLAEKYGDSRESSLRQTVVQYTNFKVRVGNAISAGDRDIFNYNLDLGRKQGLVYSKAKLNRQFRKERPGILNRILNFTKELFGFKPSYVSC